jgi:hypothetical protein
MMTSADGIQNRREQETHPGQNPLKPARLTCKRFASYGHNFLLIDIKRLGSFVENRNSKRSGTDNLWNDESTVFCPCRPRHRRLQWFFIFCGEPSTCSRLGYKQSADTGDVFSGDPREEAIRVITLAPSTLREECLLLGTCLPRLAGSWPSQKECPIHREVQRFHLAYSPFPKC